MPAPHNPHGILMGKRRKPWVFQSLRPIMLDLAYIVLGAGTLIALAVYAAALHRL